MLLFLRAYDLTSSDKPFRSKTPKKTLCLYLKTVDKVTELLLRSGGTPKLSINGNLRNTQLIFYILLYALVLTDEGLGTGTCLGVPPARVLGLRTITSTCRT